MKLGDSPKYKIPGYNPGFFRGTVSSRKLGAVLTRHAQEGYNLSQMIDESSRARILLHRGIHFSASIKRTN
jgi:hypothetical protein